MEKLNISIKNQVYTVEHPITTINLYCIKYGLNYVEITRNRDSGKWRMLAKNNKSIKLPLQPIGKVIEKCLTIIN